MSNYDWDSLKETDFDAILENSVSELPPEDMVNQVTPWRKAMNHVLIGMVLHTITLNFWNLNYILPTVGMILSLLGFRTLRRENIWFKCCWILTIVRAAYFFPSLILNATLFQSTVAISTESSIFTAFLVALIFLLFFCLERGFRAVQIKAGLPVHTKGAAALLLWYAVICLLTWFQYNGRLVGLIMLAAYIGIIYSLVKLSRELDEAGYVIQPAPVRMSNRAAATAILVVLFAGIAYGYLFWNRYPMKWQTAEASDDAALEEIREELIGLGFPETILADLADEDIRACEGAEHVVTHVKDYPMENTGDDLRSSARLRVTDIAVKLSGEREQWRLFHHFLWVNPYRFYGTESIQLFPVYGLGDDWEAMGDITGQVLYDKDGQAYKAPYHSLNSENYTSSSVFWGDEASTAIFAAFSMPGDGENYRGYLSYTIQGLQDAWIIFTRLNYTHQKGWMQYPVMTARENQMTNNWDNTGVFVTVLDAMKVYLDDVPEALGGK